MKSKSSDAKVIAAKIIDYLQSKGKLNLISEIAENLLASADSKKVFVYYAAKLSVDQKKKIISKFSKLTGSNNFYFILDKNLLGGIVVRYQDKTWDMSLRSNLDKIIQF